MHCDMFKIQDGVAIVEKLNYSKSNVGTNVRQNTLNIIHSNILYVKHSNVQSKRALWQN